MKGVDFRIDTTSFILIMLSSVLVGGIFAIVGYLGSREHFLTIINYFMVISIVGSFFFIQHWHMPVGQEWGWVTSIGILEHRLSILNPCISTSRHKHRSSY
ncbi:hypothetical protein [uncultured Dokdonia sp.]|uniref:hypothetical protein n=1 Tax=uncultured Dokdonia sp. TaxID=575653 RepID=UPI002638A401|nr:hypothetical protein [uncultured Dokdonia sp.]